MVRKRRIYYQVDFYHVTMRRNAGQDIFFDKNTHLSSQAPDTFWSANYNAFGKAQVDIAIIENNLRFPGQYFDAETSLHYNWHRYYDPATGRYMTPDPIGIKGGLNLYAYASGNPVNWIDPMGLSTIVFDRSDNSIYVTPDSSNGPLAPASFPASNRPTNPNVSPFAPEGFGSTPNGTYPMGQLIETSQGPNDAFGSWFIPIQLPLTVPFNQNRTGVGLHAGRANSWRGPGMAGTAGCTRTVEDAGDYFRSDPPTQITIRD